MLNNETFDEAILHQFIFISPSDNPGISQTKPHSSHMTDISHFEVVKGLDTHEESLAQEFLKPAEVELSSDTEDEIVLPIYSFIC